MLPRTVEAERTGIALDCLKALYILITEAAGHVRSFQELKKIRWAAEQAQEAATFWMGMRNVLNDVYEGIEGGTKDKHELKGLWFDLVKVRTVWVRYLSVQVHELKKPSDPESQLDLKYAKAGLQDDLAQFDLALEGLKQLLILAVEV